jgi:hypothetical protein
MMKITCKEILSAKEEERIEGRKSLQNTHTRNIRIIMSLLFPVAENQLPLASDSQPTMLVQLYPIAKGQCSVST